MFFTSAAHRWEVRRSALVLSWKQAHNPAAQLGWLQTRRTLGGDPEFYTTNKAFVGITAPTRKMTGKQRLDDSNFEMWVHFRIFALVQYWAGSSSRAVCSFTSGLSSLSVFRSVVLTSRGITLVWAANTLYFMFEWWSHSLLKCSKSLRFEVKYCIKTMLFKKSFQISYIFRWNQIIT